MANCFQKKLKKGKKEITLRLNLREKNDIKKSHVNDARCISKHPFAEPCSVCYRTKAIRHHNRQTHKANFSKGGIRKANQAPYIVKGFRLWDMVRLYLMAFDILEKGEINTYRDKDHNLLMSIRNGAYMNTDGSFKHDFFEMVDGYEKRLQYDSKNTELPDNPDFEQVQELVMTINAMTLGDV